MPNSRNILIALGIACAVTTAASQTVSDDVIATVNGLPITKQEYEQALLEIPPFPFFGIMEYPFYLEVLNHPMPTALRKDIESNAMSNLMRDKLAFEITKTNLPTIEEVERFMSDIESTFYTKQKEIFLAYRLKAGHTDESFRQLVRQRMGISRYLERMGNDIQVTPEEIREYFDSHKSQFPAQEKILARMVVAKSRSVVREMSAKLSKGTDFAELAQQYSSVGAEKSGALGAKPGIKQPSAVSRKDLKGLPARLLDEAFDRLEGGSTPWIGQDRKFYIIKVEKHLGLQTNERSAIETQIAQRVREIKQKIKVQMWLNDLLSQAKIEYIKKSEYKTFDVNIQDTEGNQISWSDLRSDALSVALRPIYPNLFGESEITEIPEKIMEFWRKAYQEQFEQEAEYIQAQKWAKNLGYSFYGSNQYTFDGSESLAAQLAKVSAAEIAENYQKNASKYKISATLTAISDFKFSNLEQAKKFQREILKTGEIPSGYEKNFLVTWENWTISAAYFKSLKPLTANTLSYVSDVVTINKNFHTVNYAFNYIPGRTRPLKAVASQIENQILELRRTKLKKEWNEQITQAARASVKLNLDDVIVQLEQHPSPQ